jgi:hypothetical protein
MPRGVSVLAFWRFPVSPQQAEWLGWAVLAAVVYAVAYVTSLRLHPYRNCRACRGSGKHRGAIFERAFRACRKCGGTGRALRFGARRP